MRAPPRLVLVVNDAAFFLSHRLPIALGARDAGFDVHVATPQDDAAARIEALGLPFHAIPLSRRGTSPADELRTIRALIALYRELTPDIVHHVTAKPILYGGIAARIARVPAVVHAVSGLGHVFISEHPRARLIRQAIRATYRVVTSHPNCAVIFQNDDDRRTFGRAIRTSRIVMIRGSGVDLGQFRRTPLPDGPPLVVLPSRMLWDKGVGEFVEAARILKRQGVGARFALVGGIDPGNPAAVPAKRIDRWVAEGAVEWWGLRDDMPAVLARASLVCLPSYREGMPKVLLEACAAGRPIVTTDVPGCRDVVAGGDHGVLVPARDAAALARAIGNLVDDRAALERMATAAAEAARAFAIDEVLAQTLALYRLLMR
ncbi:MAG: glycosyltransferase family 4 protein [Labilithrix sp.]|nr:glycosyltransferase family 4 protein [Labilithrix sp.]